MNGSRQNGPSAWLLASAALRLRGRHGPWADAMLAEADSCASDVEVFRWACGCWLASLCIAPSIGWMTYAAALSLGLALMTGYEWSADESAATLAMLCAIALSLGALRPRRALLSGVLVGLVVTCVIGFEAVSGIRPAYETRVQTLAHGLHWMILLPPGVLSAAAGAALGSRLRPVSPPS